MILAITIYLVTKIIDFLAEDEIINDGFVAPGLAISIIVALLTDIALIRLLFKL